MGVKKQRERGTSELVNSPRQAQQLLRRTAFPSPLAPSLCHHCYSQGSQPPKWHPPFCLCMTLPLRSSTVPLKYVSNRPASVVQRTPSCHSCHSCLLPFPTQQPLHVAIKVPLFRLCSPTALGFSLTVLSCTISLLHKFSLSLCVLTLLSLSSLPLSPPPPLTSTLSPTTILYLPLLPHRWLAD